MNVRLGFLVVTLMLGFTFGCSPESDRVATAPSDNVSRGISSAESGIRSEADAGSERSPLRSEPDAASESEAPESEANERADADRNTEPESPEMTEPTESDAASAKTSIDGPSSSPNPLDVPDKETNDRARPRADSSSNRADRDMPSDPDPGTEAADSLLAKVEPSGKTGTKVGDTIPEISGKDVEGMRFRLSDYEGKVVMVDFWGDW